MNKDKITMEQIDVVKASANDLAKKATQEINK